MRRLVALLIALVAAWLGATGIGPVHAASGFAVHTYTYDRQHGYTAARSVTSERGPPSTSGSATTYDAVDRWSRGGSADPDGSTPRGTNTYDDPTALVQDASVATPTGGKVEDADGWLPSLARSRVAAETASSGAESAIAGRNLARQLASEQQMADVGTPLAGAGTGTKLRAAERLAADYGGAAGDWAKMGSSSYRGADGFQFETHWYENVLTGARFEFKTKFQWLP